MKSIKMSELVEGDIFTHEYKATDREAFEVIEQPTGRYAFHKKVRCKSRTSGIEINKDKRGQVIWLRNINNE